MIQEYTSCLSTDDFAKAIELTRHSTGWRFSQSSNKDDGFTFWYLDLTTTPFFTEDVANRIREITGLDFMIDRVYANGQTYGLCGSVHRDRQPCEQGEYRTFLLYTHPEWDMSWGGMTVIYDEDTKEETIIIPKPNHAVLFDSKMPHIGYEPTRHCKELRVSVAFKLSLV